MKVENLVLYIDDKGKPLTACAIINGVEHVSGDVREDNEICFSTSTIKKDDISSTIETMEYLVDKGVYQKKNLELLNIEKKYPFLYVIYK